MRLNIQYVKFFFIVSVVIFAIPTLQAGAEETSKDQEQKQTSNSKDGCKDDLVQVLRYDGKPECVEPENVLKLIESGWISQKNIDQISILNKRMYKVSDNTYAFQFDYCAAVYNKGALGIIVSSSIEKIPLQIDPNIKEHQCHQYGTQIHAFSYSIPKTSIFYEEDMKTLFGSFEKKKMNLENDLVYNQQKLLKLQESNLEEDNSEEINRLEIQNNWINIAIQSYKEGLNILRSLL